MKKTNLPDLNEILMHQLFRTGRLLRFYIQQFLDIDKFAFTPEQFFLFYRLYVNDGQTQRELADKTLNDHPNITRLIDKLEEKGYVKRKPDKDDRRTFTIKMSEEGIHLFERMLPIVEAERKKLLKGISTEEQQIVKRVLNQLENNMNN